MADSLQISGEDLSLTHGNLTLGKQHLACGHAGCVLANGWWIHLGYGFVEEQVKSGKALNLLKPS